MSKTIEILSEIVDAILYAAFMIVVGIAFVIYFGIVVLFDFTWGLIEKLYKRLFK